MTKDDEQHDFSLLAVPRKLNGFRMTRSEWLGQKDGSMVVELSLLRISILRNSNKIIL
ncbi:Uncharacterized protein BM_BM14272 [Brugia malayi]|uniref:Bm14272 n=1 Tax=Brugia malayi TaxID=6279 RepID=A0A0J9Y1I5_BRUMA|nr:Uncharacterized protein BM_BM14272 [Brugia malayi]CDP99906.1 Bm14272 [Brugia malayi]VIO91661.1 Uncharacterized protein BM_BM14272 [Brugia malayi]